MQRILARVAITGAVLVIIAVSSFNVVDSGINVFTFDGLPALAVQ
jgi:hypothetical protein